MANKRSAVFFLGSAVTVYLSVELGRRRRPIIQFEDRLCPHCGVLGDEIYYLLLCEKYNRERVHFLENIKNLSHNHSEQELLHHIFNSDEAMLLEKLSTFINLLSN